MTRTILAAVSLLLTACATATDPGVERYEGFYTWGFEVNGFEPCGSTESWWVTEGDLHTRYGQVSTGEYQPVFVRLEGEVGPEGRYGHMGAYTREIAVREVVEMRPVRDADCR